MPGMGVPVTQSRRLPAAMSPRLSGPPRQPARGVYPRHPGQGRGTVTAVKWTPGMAVRLVEYDPAARKLVPGGEPVPAVVTEVSGGYVRAHRLLVGLAIDGPGGSLARITGTAA